MKRCPAGADVRLVGRGKVVLHVRNRGGGSPGPTHDLDFPADARADVPWLLGQLRRAGADPAACRRVCAGSAGRVAVRAEILARRAERAAYRAAFARE